MSAPIPRLNGSPQPGCSRALWLFDQSLHLTTSYCFSYSPTTSLQPYTTNVSSSMLDFSRVLKIPASIGGSRPGSDIHMVHTEGNVLWTWLRFPHCCHFLQVAQHVVSTQQPRGVSTYTEGGLCLERYASLLLTLLLGACENVLTLGQKLIINKYRCIYEP